MCFIVVHLLLAKRCCWVDPCLYIIHVIISIQINLFFSSLVMFRFEQSKLYWNRGSAFMLMPCDANHWRKKEILTSFKRLKWSIRSNKRLHLKCCLIFENKYYSINIKVNKIKRDLGYLRLGISQRRWIHVTDRNNASVIIGAAPISTGLYSGAPMLCWL